MVLSRMTGIRSPRKRERSSPTPAGKLYSGSFSFMNQFLISTQITEVKCKRQGVWGFKEHNLEKLCLQGTPLPEKCTPSERTSPVGQQILYDVKVDGAEAKGFCQAATTVPGYLATLVAPSDAFNLQNSMALLGNADEDGEKMEFNGICSRCEICVDRNGCKRRW